MQNNICIFNNNERVLRRKTLNYIAFIKFWAMLLIIKWHVIPWKKIKIDYGARMCEILFVSSGFLVGYNYYKRPLSSTYQSSFKYAYKHLRMFYPLEIINIIYGIHSYYNKLEIIDIQIIVINVLIMKSWSRYNRIVNRFNGITWFLSSLLFCYFLTPILLQGIKNIKNSLMIFILFAFIRIALEIIIYKSDLNLLDVNFHRGPFVRCMEFYLGMLIAPLFYKINNILDKYRNKIWIKGIFTLIQIVLPFGIYFIMLKYNLNLKRCYFVLIFCLFIFICGFDYGYLSDIFEMKIAKIIMSHQMEMYLLQKTVNNILLKIMNKVQLKFPPILEFEYYVKLLIIYIFAFIYKKWMKENLAKILDIVVILIKKIFQ